MRMYMGNPGLILIAVFAFTNLGYSQINGFVYEDKNENGSFDYNELSLSGIVVTDGFEVVKTNKKGQFVLPENPIARFISITTPSGYKHTTRFYQTIGADMLTFGLKKINQQAKKFIQVTDMHAGGLDNWVGNLKQYVKNNDVDFIVLTGDLARKYGMDLYALEVTDETMGSRVVYTIGNHDLVKGDYGEQYFENKFGPVYYSFDVGNTHFIVTPMLNMGDVKPSYDTTQILNWLQKDIEMQPKDKPLVIFNHDNWLWDEECVVRGSEKSIDFKNYNLKAFIYGHFHMQFTTTFENGIKIYTTSTLDKGGRNHCPSAYREFTFDIGNENDIISETRFSDLKNHLVSNAYKQDDNMKVVVSAYHALGKTNHITVNYGGEKMLMKQNTNFAWEAEIPFTNKNISVTATFSDGNRISHHAEVDSCLEWITNIGGNVYYTVPLIHEEVIYTASIDDDMNEKCGIHAIDAKTGKKLWYFHTKNSVINDIVYSEGKILACDSESILYAIEAKTGKLKWKRKLSDSLKHIFKNGIRVKNGVVYAGQLSYISAIRVSDGEVLWRYEGNIPGESSVSTHDISNGRLHGTTSFGCRYAIDAKTGELIWMKRTKGSPYNYSHSSALFYKGKMYYTYSRSIVEADPATGKILREVKTSHYFNTASAPVEKDGILYLGMGDEGVIAYDIDTMKKKWIYFTQPSLFYTAPYMQYSSAGVASTLSIVDDKIFFGANDGNLYCLGIKEGEYIWSRNLGAPILSDVLIDGNSMYVSDYTGNLYKYDISSVLKIKHNVEGVRLMRSRF